MWSHDKAVVGDNCTEEEAIALVGRLQRNPFEFQPTDRQGTCDLYVELLQKYPVRVVEVAIQRVVERETRFPPFATVKQWIDTVWPKVKYRDGRPVSPAKLTRVK